MKNIIFWIVGILFTLFITTIIFRFGLVFYSSLSDWYEMSGIVTSGVTVLLLITTLIIIREAMRSNVALQESNTKLQTANDEMRDSNIKILFNSTFHPLLSQHNVILNELRQTIEKINFDVQETMSNFNEGFFIEDSFKQGASHDYFRVLYQVLNIIKSSGLTCEEQKTYSNILRAFIDNKTLYYVALNASQRANSHLIYPEYVKLIEHFQLLEHLNILSIEKEGIEHPYINVDDLIMTYKQDAYGDKVNINAFITKHIKIIKTESGGFYKQMREIIENFRQVKKSPFNNLSAARDPQLYIDYVKLKELKNITKDTFDENTTFLFLCHIIQHYTGENFIYGEINDFINFQKKLNLEHQGILDIIEKTALNAKDSIELYVSLRNSRRKLKLKLTKLLDIQSNYIS